MKRKYTGLLFVLSLLAFTSLARAGIYLEPYAGVVLGYSSQHTTINDPTASPALETVSRDTATTGTAFGGKLGLSFGPIAFGGDYMAGKVKLFSAGKDDMTNLGAFVQLTLPFVKLSATSFFDSKANGDKTNAKGSGIKAGIGFLFLPLLSLNVEYLKLTYTSATADKEKSTVKSFSQKTDGVLISLSLPI